MEGWAVSSISSSPGLRPTRYRSSQELADLRSEARRLRREGASITEIADELGVVRSQVGRWLRHVPRGAGDQRGAAWVDSPDRPGPLYDDEPPPARSTALAPAVSPLLARMLEAAQARAAAAGAAPVSPAAPAPPASSWPTPPHVAAHVPPPAPAPSRPATGKAGHAGVLPFALEPGALPPPVGSPTPVHRLDCGHPARVRLGAFGTQVVCPMCGRLAFVGPALSS